MGESAHISRGWPAIVKSVLYPPSKTTYTNGQPTMRTHIDIDADLMARAQDACGGRTREATVEEALRTLIRLREQEEILGLAGQVRWEGDLDESRLGRAAK